jgi:hypothetical protein
MGYLVMSRQLQYEKILHSEWIYVAFEVIEMWQSDEKHCSK